MANFYMVPGGAGAKNGSDWDNAFSLVEFSTWFINTCAPGDNLYIYSGTYTLTRNIISARDGTLASRINFIGVSNQSLLTPAIGDDRPLFMLGSYIFIGDDFFVLSNIRTYTETGTNTSAIIRFDTATRLINCSFINMSNLANSESFHLGGTAGFVSDCEFITNNGNCLLSYGGFFIDSYFKGATLDGLYLAGNGSGVQRCIFNDCAVGINIVGNSNGIDNCTFYNCSIGIKGNNTGYHVIYNSIFSDCGDGVNFTTDPFESINLFYNNYYNNTNDTVNCNIGINNFFINPAFSNVAMENFSLLSSSGLIGIGKTMKLYVS